MAARSIEETLALVDAKWPGCFWFMAKGRLTPSEPLYAFQVLSDIDSEKVLSQGEAETLQAAISAALVLDGEPAGSGDADGGGDGNDDHPDVTAQRVVESAATDGAA